MKKALHELVTYIWIPFILTLTFYIIRDLGDIPLAIITLVTFSAIYATVRLYFVRRDWWLLVIVLLIVLAPVVYLLMRPQMVTLSLNGQTVTSSSVSFTEGLISMNPAPGVKGKYTKDTVVTLTANPVAGYGWKSWSGTSNDTSNPTTVVLNGDKQIAVNFEPHLSLVINNQLVIGSIVSFAEGLVSVDPPPGDDEKYTDDTVVTLTASAGSGYDWERWSGTNSDKSNPTTVTMGSNKHLTVTFEPRFSLIINNQLVIGSSLSFDEGSVSVFPTPGDDDKYTKDTVVTLTAIPASGYGWKSWMGTANGAINPTTVVMSSEKHASVTFEQRFQLAINNQVVTETDVSLSGGSVAVSPAPGVDGRYAKDTIVRLTATPAPGYRFDRWSGDVSGNVTPASVTMSSSRGVAVTFIRLYTLTTSVSPEGSGSISPVSGTYDEGSTVTLTASPAAGYRFDHWSGDASGSADSVSVTVSSSKSVTAHFVKVHNLTASVSPAGSGSVSPAGGTFDEGSTVALIASSASGYRFDHWSGDASGTEALVNITMNANKSVTAHFVKVYTLTISVEPAEGGSVSPAGGTYDEGAAVILTATANSGYQFDHWGGDVSGTEASISVTMNSDKSITAIFIDLEL